MRTPTHPGRAEPSTAACHPKDGRARSQPSHDKQQGWGGTRGSASVAGSRWLQQHWCGRRRLLLRLDRFHPRGQIMKSKRGSEKKCCFIIGSSPSTLFPLNCSLPEDSELPRRGLAQPNSKFTEILETGKQVLPHLLGHS